MDKGVELEWVYEFEVLGEQSTPGTRVQEELLITGGYLMGLEGGGNVFIQHTFESFHFLRYSIFFKNFGHVRCSYGYYF